MNHFINRHELIDELTSSHKDRVVDEAIRLWGLLASKLLVIIGESGLDALYARTLYLTQPTFPFLKGVSMHYGPENRFDGLKQCLTEQSPEFARQSNHQLFVNFTDILASLIGEELTLRILLSAWCVEPNPLWIDSNK